MKVSLPIVGSIFRPPALQVLQQLPFEAELLLEREPDNPHDSGVIKVLLPCFSPTGLHAFLYNACLSEAIPNEAELSRGQFYLSALTDPLHLGYIGKKTGHAPLLSFLMDKDLTFTLPATLGALVNGNHAAIVDLPSENFALASELEALEV